MRSDKFGSQLERKSKTWFLIFPVWMFMNRRRQNSDLTAYTSKILVLCRPELTKEGPHGNGFSNFQIQKWVLQTVRAQKVDGKNGIIFLISIFLSWVMVLKLPKIVHVFKFVLTSARNLNILKEFISIHLKYLIMLFQKMVFFIGVQDINSSWDIKE